jgi:hypothetical protein
MPGIKYDPEISGQFGFLVDALGSKHLLTSGGKVDASAITATNGRKSLPEGTLVTRARGDELFTPVIDNTTIPATNETYISAHAVVDADDNADIELMRHFGASIYYNRLPHWGDLGAANQAWVHGHYNTQKAAG